jgi:hypothetical protein
MIRLTWQDPDKNSIATCWLFFKKIKNDVVLIYKKKLKNKNKK